MARSLTVNHDEKPSTTPLLTVFLLLSAAVLAGSAMLTATDTHAGAEEADAAAAEPAATP